MPCIAVANQILFVVLLLFLLSLAFLASWRLFSFEVRFALLDERGHAFGKVTRRRAARERLHLGVELRRERPVVALVDQPLGLAERQRRAEREPTGNRLRFGPEPI